MDRGVFHCLGKILTPLLDSDRGCQSVWGWTQSHTHIHKKGGGDLGVLGQLIYSLHPFLILISCPSVSCIKRSQPAPSSPSALSFSKPLAHLSQPLHIPSHLPLLSTSLYSLLAALGRCHADLTPLSWAFGHQPARGGVRRMGVLLAWRSAKEIWPQSNGRSHPLCALTHSDNDGKQLRPKPHHHSLQIKSETLLLVQLWGFSCSSSC